LVSFTDFQQKWFLGILPLFIVTNLGASRAILGAIEGSAELVLCLQNWVSGSLSDRVGKRKIFCFGWLWSIYSMQSHFLHTDGLMPLAVRLLSRRIERFDGQLHVMH